MLEYKTHQSALGFALLLDPRLFRIPQPSLEISGEQGGGGRGTQDLVLKDGGEPVGKLGISLLKLCKGGGTASQCTAKARKVGKLTVGLFGVLLLGATKPQIVLKQSGKLFFSCRTDQWIGCFFIYTLASPPGF